MSNQSAVAPEKIRANVKLAASMSFCFSATRQSSELLAKAIIASDVSMKIRAILMEETSNLEFDRNALGVACRFCRRAAQRIFLLIDLFPEPAAVRNIWENKLALVKGERVGAVVAAER